MTLREKILKTFVVTIREINTHGGPKEFFKKYPVGGMYYMYAEGPYDENGYELGSGMTVERLKECQSAAENKMLICADFANMDGQKIFAGLKSVGAAADEELAYEYGKVVGMQMNAFGIDWVLAPYTDLYYSNTSPHAGITDDPILTAKLMRQVIKGIQDQGVCATAKHFPGLGTNNVNMHHAADRNVLSFDEWMKTYGHLYREMIKENPMSIMTTHTMLQSYDNECMDGYLPIATYSKKLTDDLLRGELGFKGAVVTDALIMGGMATGDLIEETAQAFKSGADLLLWPPVEAADRIEELINLGEIPMSRLDEALERIDNMMKFREDALKNKIADEPSCDYVNSASAKIVSAGMCCLKNEIDLLPLDKNKHKKVLIIDVEEEEGANSTELLKKAFEKRGAEVKVCKDVYDKISIVCWQADADELQKDMDLVIFNLNAPYASEFNSTFMTIWGSHMYDKSKKIIVNYGSPFFAEDYFMEDPTFVETNCIPSEEAVEILVKKLFGEDEFTGKSIVKNRFVKPL